MGDGDPAEAPAVEVQAGAVLCYPGFSEDRPQTPEGRYATSRSSHGREAYARVWKLTSILEVLGIQKFSGMGIQG